MIVRRLRNNDQSINRTHDSVVRTLGMSNCTSVPRLELFWHLECETSQPMGHDSVVIQIRNNVTDIEPMCNVSLFEALSYQYVRGIKHSADEATDGAREEIVK